MEPIDPNGLKAELPKELREAMKLDEDQFEELEVNTLHICIQYADVCADLDFGEEPSTMEVAYRPSRNPRGQYYAVEYSLMIDPKTRGMRCEVMAFKPMNRTEYIAYCIKEYGEAPTGLVEDPTLN